MAFTSDVLTTQTTKFKFLITIALLCTLPVFVNLQNRQKQGKVPRYSMITKFMSAGSLNIDIFADEKNIKENPLRSLMQHFFKKYQKHEILFIHIYTHQSQLRDLGKIEVIEPNEEAERHPKATIVRSDGEQEINIKLPNRDWHTITVKERDENK